MTVRATAILLRSIAAESSWRSPVIAVKQASDITSAAVRVNNKGLASVTAAESYDAVIPSSSIFHVPVN